MNEDHTPLLAATEQLLAETYHQMLRAGWKDDRLIERVKAQRREIRRALGLPEAEA